MKKTLMLAAILTVGTSMIAMAEENIASQRLNETVISTENFETSVLDIAKNVTIVTQEDIQNKGANTVAEALKGVPGLVVRGYDGGTPQFDMRGSGATSGSNTIVLLDGVPLNGIAGNSYNTDQIPVDQIVQIEVIPAGGAVMYGDGAIGGVVNIITKSPENRANYGSVGLEYGSYSRTKGTLTYGTKIGNKFLFDLSYTNYRGEDYQSKNKTDTYKKYDKKDKKDSIWLRGKYLLDDGYIEAKYSHSEDKNYYTGYLTKAQFDKDPSQASSYNGVTYTIYDSYNLTYKKKLNDKFDFLIYGAYDEQESKNMDKLSKQIYIKPQLKYTYGENSYLIVGGDYKDGKMEDQNGKEKDKTRESYAGYLMNKTTVGKFQFTQGYRREKIKYDAPMLNYIWNPAITDWQGNLGVYEKKEFGNKKDYTVNSYEFAVNYLYSETGSIYLSFVHAFRGPNMWDLNAWYGEIDLQETDSYELGIKDMIGNTYISASVFLTDTDNEIYLDKIQRIQSGKYPYDNKNFDGKVRRIGGQIALQHDFNKLVLREGVAYIQPKVKSGVYDGNEFAGVSRWQGNIGATYKFNKNLLGNIDLYYLGKAYAEDDFKNYFGKQGGYTTVDTNLRYKFDEGLEVYAGIRNLFDEGYATAITSSIPSNLVCYYPAPGRNYYIGFKYNF